MKRLSPPAVALAALLASGCMNLAPDYARPSLPVADAWPAGTKPPVAQPLPAPVWRDYYRDPRLRQLIETALADNRDLRLAALDIDKARALYRVQAAEALPKLDAGLSQSVQRTPGQLSQSGRATVSRQYTAQLGVSAWELDLWGRLKNLETQALESYFSSAEARRATQLTLIAEVANAWLTLAADRERLALARETLASQQASYRLTERTVSSGIGSGLDLAQARTSVETARGDVATYSAQVEQDRNALRLLLGSEPPENLLPDKLPADAATLAEVPVGLPSSVLLQRPDILAAEHTLIGANASIGAARAAFFPTITLTGAGGSASARLGSLFSGASGFWSFAPSISLPIFDGGANQANLDAAKVDRDIAVTTYEKTIQTAFREVADALATRSTIQDRLSAQRALVDASADSYRLSEARFRRGVDSYLSTLDSQRSLYSAQQNLISVRLARLSNGVDLYKVLGGGAGETEATGVVGMGLTLNR
ncbi:MAG TPA: efflux transporter outer membrane subunit [Plasticicumulans sp.]|nr:efflux transporter outer membrane subunit [Plasticicumulans sp.]